MLFLVLKMKIFILNRKLFLNDRLCTIELSCDGKIKICYLRSFLKTLR